MKTIALLTIAIALSAFGCESDSPLSDTGLEMHTDINAVVVYTGDPAVDGCGWLIKDGEDYYAPVNLGSGFKTDGLEVLVSYQLLESTWNCGFRTPGVQQIKVQKIERR